MWLGAAIAQETGDESVTIIEEVDEDEARQDKVVVTGSRIQRSEFTSIKPVQVISGEVSRDIGLVDAASLLQESTAATGLQIDTTFNGFVLDNGPGASTIDLRGLGASRTLVLVNGRRLGASGVEGAPGVPDLNLIPSSLIDRIDVLLDGASSIYGSDAVAGVANVILRKDFDGFEIEGSMTAPTHEGGGGGNQFVSANWGVSNDRGFMGFGAEWSKQDNLKLDDRPDFFGDCATPYEITTTGEVRDVDVQSVTNFGQGLSQNPCNLAFGINRIWIDPMRLSGAILDRCTTRQERPMSAFQTIPKPRSSGWWIILTKMATSLSTFCHRIISKEAIRRNGSLTFRPTSKHSPHSRMENMVSAMI